jgi:hypothetical protein
MRDKGLKGTTGKGIIPLFWGFNHFLTGKGTFGHYSNSPP